MSGSELRDWVRARWGLAAFWIFAAVGTYRLFAHPGNQAHFRLFRGAADALARGEVAYGPGFGTRIGSWFYSPTCGLMVFKPLAVLPYDLALGLYTAVCLGVFVTGIRALTRALPAKCAIDSRAEQILWLAAGPPVMSAILGSRIEMLMAGMLARIAASLLAERSREWRSAIPLSLLVNWKFLALPAALLLSLVRFARKPREGWVFPLVWGALTLFWFAAPAALMGVEALSVNHAEWSRRLTAYAQSGYLNFDNLFKSVRGITGYAMPYGATQALTGVAAAACASAALFVAKKGDGQRALLLALALGGVFSTVFSPLHQNNSYPWLAPALWAFVALAGASEGARRVALSMALVVAFGYSNLWGHVTETAWRAMALKPLALFLGMIVLAVREVKLARQ